VSLTAELKKHAAERGIDLIGVTSAEPLEVDGWGGPIMNSREYLEDATCVVVFGYYQLDVNLAERSSSAAPRGRLIPGLGAFFDMDEYCSAVVAGYLSRKGYDAVRRKLQDKIALKPLAVKAGLGLYGKNSIVHCESYGSWIQLGCVVTNAPLETRNHPYKRSDCGDCTACVDACPTGAIAEPFHIESSLCIANWLDTGGVPIPREVRHKAGDRLCGCEVCQLVCPKNEGLEPRARYPIEVTKIAPTAELVPLLLEDEKELEARFPRLVPEVIGVSTLRRNAALALGNVRDSSAVPALVGALGDPESKVRSYAAWALGRIGGSKAREALARALTGQVDPEVQEEITAALQECANQRPADLG